MQWPDQLTDLLGIRYPIIQAPMLGIATPDMVAMASRAGCLGNLPVGGMSPEQIRHIIRATRLKTSHPFAVGLFVHHTPVVDDALRIRYDEARQKLQKLMTEHAIEVALPDIDELEIYDYRDQLNVLIEEDVTMVSFTFGVPDDSFLEELRSRNVRFIGTCSTLEEGRKLLSKTMDALVVQGNKAGGHRGTFSDEDHPWVSVEELLKLLRNETDLPLVAAGGIRDTKTMQTVFRAGASGVQVGSMLLRSPESQATDNQRQILKESDRSSIVLTNTLSGRYARGVRNTFIEELSKDPDLILPYPYHNKLTAVIRKQAKAHDRTEFMSTWSGIYGSEAPQASTLTILQQLISNFESVPDS